MCKARHLFYVHFFFFNDTATTEIYTLSLHDALPISLSNGVVIFPNVVQESGALVGAGTVTPAAEEERSEEHTSELQSLTNLVCRLLLEKKRVNTTIDVVMDVHQAHLSVL